MQRYKGNRRHANSDEKKYHEWLADQPCCISGQYGVEIHHCYGSGFVNNKVLIGHWAAIPLSYNYHRGANGIHTIGRNAWRELHGAEADLCCVHFAKYMKETQRQVPADVLQSIISWGR